MFQLNPIEPEQGSQDHHQYHHITQIWLQQDPDPQAHDPDKGACDPA
jgi:hypothetical protein